jgi:anaerobic magnesium-protoporphyrin IX monomethyl ester cyclase
MQLNQIVNERKKVILVGIAGSNNAFSLSLYNLKAYAYQNLTIRDRCDIDVIQHPLINPGQSINKRILSDLSEKIISKRPYLIGFSCYMWNLDSFLKIAAIIKKKLPDVRILLGGPEIATEYVQSSYFDKYPIDYCVSGEGEQTFLELLLNLENNNPAVNDIHGLSYRANKNSEFIVNAKREPFKSLSEIPSPYLSGIVDEEVLGRYGVEANLETQRGCNLRCSYCIYHKDMDKVSYSEVKRVIDEVRHVTKRGVKKIRFVDANFSSDKDHAKAVMKGLINENFRTGLFFELIPGFLDEELADLFGQYRNLHKDNEITIGVGVQTINLDVLKLIRRKIKKEKFEMTFKLLQKHDIYTKIDLIIGLPSEDISSIERTIEYMVDQLRESRAHLLCCHVMRGLPGTELMDIAKEKQMIFSSKYEPHELIESPTLPRQDMIKTLRRTAILFRLINHVGWANREFVYSKTSNKTNIRDLFFSTKDQLSITNVQLIDLIVEKCIEHLKPTKSWFSMPDFPYAETWWWVHSSREVSNEWLINCLSDLKTNTFIPKTFSVLKSAKNR